MGFYENEPEYVAHIEFPSGRETDVPVTIDSESEARDEISRRYRGPMPKIEIKGFSRREI